MVFWFLIFEGLIIVIVLVLFVLGLFFVLGYLYLLVVLLVSGLFQKFIVSIDQGLM